MKKSITCLIKEYRMIYKDIDVIFFVLFLFAGYFKKDPHVNFIQKNIDITLLFFILTLLFFVVRFIVYQGKIYLPTTFYKSIIVFFIISWILILGAVARGNWDYGFQKSLRFTILTGWAYVGSALIITNSNKLEKFAWLLVVFSIFMGISGFVKYYNKTTIVLEGLQTNYIGTARTLGLGFIVIFAYLVTSSNLTKKYFLLPISGLLLAFDLMTGSRGPTISLGISIFVFLLIGLNRRYSFWERTKIIIFLIIMTMGVVGIVSFLGRWDLFARLFYRFRILIEGKSPSATLRMFYIRESLELWSQSPIFGGGAGLLGSFLIGDNVRLYPHNIFIELLSETGIVGLFCFNFILFKAIKALYANIRKRRSKSDFLFTFLFIATIFYLTNSMFSGDLNDNRILFTFLSLSIIGKRRFLDS